MRSTKKNMKKNRTELCEDSGSSVCEKHFIIPKSKKGEFFLMHVSVYFVQQPNKRDCYECHVIKLCMANEVFLLAKMHIMST